MSKSYLPIIAKYLILLANLLLTWLKTQIVVLLVKLNTITFDKYLEWKIGLF